MKRKDRSKMSTRSTEKKVTLRFNDYNSNGTSVTTRSRVRKNNLQSIKDSVELRNAERMVVSKSGKQKARRVTGNDSSQHSKPIRSKSKPNGITKTSIIIKSSTNDKNKAKSDELISNKNKSRLSSSFQKVEPLKRHDN